DRGVQAVFEIHEGVRGPDLLAQLFAGYHFTGILQQRDEYLHRLGLDLQLLALFEDFSSASVDGEKTESECHLGLSLNSSLTWRSRVQVVLATIANSARTANLPVSHFAPTYSLSITYVDFRVHLASTLSSPRVHCPPGRSLTKCAHWSPNDRP